MEIRFWGVRGSVAASGAQVASVGGNTSCVEVLSGSERLILDAGTGIRALGDRMLESKGPHRATLLFSHLHWDHVQGFPFFAPAYVPTTELSLHGPGEHGALLAALNRQMSPPSFPVTLDAMRARLRFEQARPDVPFQVGPFRVRPFALPHPNGCLGYRIEADGKVFVYATDVELSVAALTDALVSGLGDSDVLCLDAQYTPDEYHGRAGVPKKGWGHSTMVDAAEIAKAVGARKLVLFHHDPSHGDAMIDRMVEEAKAAFPDVCAAREQTSIRLGGRRPRAKEAAHALL